MLNTILFFLIPLSNSLEITIDSILSNYNTSNNINTRSSNVETLAYVTYWGDSGYPNAGKLWHKFNYIGGAWHEFEIEKDALNNLNFTIATYKLQNFMTYATEYGIKSQIFPQFEMRKEVNIGIYREFLQNENMASTFGDAIYEKLMEYNFTGCILNMIKGGTGILKQYMPDYPEYRKLQIIMVGKIVKHLALKNIKTMVVVPEAKYDARPDFDSDEFMYLFKDVYRFIVTTNDYFKATPGPNSPMLWVRKNVNYLMPKASMNGTNLNSHTYDEYKKKIMFTAPLFGREFNLTSPRDNKYENRDIVGASFIQIIQDRNPNLTWVDQAAELKMDYTVDSWRLIAYYPIQESITERIRFAKRLGTGVTFWELNQGLLYNFDNV
jgi:chitinase domain-containing protein 1